MRRDRASGLRVSKFCRRTDWVGRVLVPPAGVWERREGRRRRGRGGRIRSSMRLRMILEERLADGLSHKPAHQLLLVELHFPFGGVNIHIDRPRTELQEEATHREAAFHQGGVVSFQKREVQAAVLDRAAVNEQMLLIPRAP